MESYFITGIGTGVGKTLISAILVNKFKADYWKPIQAGDLENTDRIMRDTFWVGVFPGLSEEQLAFVADRITSFLDSGL